MDMTGWLEYFVEGLSTQLAEVKDRGEQTIRKDVIAKQHNLFRPPGFGFGSYTGAWTVEHSGL